MINIFIRTNTALKNGEPVKYGRFPGTIERLDHRDKIIPGSDSWEVIQEKLAKIIGYSISDYRSGDISEIILK